MPVFLIALFSLFISVSVQANDIVSARFAMETDRYKHCVLGDCMEYGAVEAVMNDGKVLAFRLPDQSVFEDIEPRLVPMGLNGRNAILTVRSYPDKGAALVLVGQRRGKLQIVAESAPIGTANRWQNPIGVGDFDRDGILEIASVITPHIGGKLTIFERKGNKLVEDKSAYPFSNHKMGSSILDLHEIMDWNGDKTPDIILPDVTRRILKVVTFANGKAEILAEKEFSFLITGPIIASDNSLQIQLSDGNMVNWKP